MTRAGDTLLAGLDARLWHGSLTDKAAPERDVIAALQAGAPYRVVEMALRQIRERGLPGAKAAHMASMRWPGSIDFAVLAHDLADAAARGPARAHLESCVWQGNRRRAALANLWLRQNCPDRACSALAFIDAASSTACDDLHRRAELALACGDFTAAAADIDALAQAGRAPQAAALRLRLVHLSAGARALAELFDGLDKPPVPVCRAAFEAFAQEGDFTRAPAALAHWQKAAGADQPALIRAATRLALEQGDPDRAEALLLGRIDPDRPWSWDSTAHVHWIRLQMARQADPAQIRDHAMAAARLHPHHDWLAHLARAARETVEDWRNLVPVEAAPAIAPERAMIAARAALRMGLPGHAAGRLAQARRAASGTMAARLHLLRAECFRAAGRLGAAGKAQEAAQALAANAPLRADAGLVGAELALMAGDPVAADADLSEAAQCCPERMAVWLTRARIAFQCGDFLAAVAAHDTFNRLKQAQIGAFPATDVRDRIAQDAVAASRGANATCAGSRPVAESLQALGLPRVAGSPGLAACLLQRALARGALAFSPGPRAAIPRKIAHYWEGPTSPALERSRAQWRRLHPEFETVLFDLPSAADWLARHAGAAILARFHAMTHPALRADLFRLCWVLHAGGVFADLDEYPRLPVTPWLQDAEAVFCIERGFGTVANNFLAAMPEHPVAQSALDLVCQALDATDDPYPWWHTGPAQWTRAVLPLALETPVAGLRFLAQSEYDRRVSTNLPFPHKRRPDHWR